MHVLFANVISRDTFSNIVTRDATLQSFAFCIVADGIHCCRNKGLDHRLNSVIQELKVRKLRLRPRSHFPEADFGASCVRTV